MWYTYSSVVLVACTLSLTVTGNSAIEDSNCTDCIIVNFNAGYDQPSCLEKHSTIPCKTLTYVFTDDALTNKEVVLQGDHWINHTLTVSGVDCLLIRASGNTYSTINCRVPDTSNDTGSGLVFRSVSNLTISNVIFERCGALKYGTRTKYRSAVYIINSTNIHIKGSRFYRNVGRGLFLEEVVGHISITKCEFLENAILEEEAMLINGGGGISVHFAHGTSVCPECSSHYEIEDSVFGENIATNTDIYSHLFEFKLSIDSDPYTYGDEGGGIYLHLSGHCRNTSISVDNCTFYNNSAVFGGGVYVLLHNYTQDVAIFIHSCTFTNNTVQKSGGALTLAHVVRSNSSGNGITVRDTTFLRNKAQWGGGVNVYPSKMDKTTKNTFRFINCTWIENSASIGSAMVVKPTPIYSILDGGFPAPSLCNCSFINNQATRFLMDSVNNIPSQHALENGVVDVYSMKIEFSKYVAFIGNTGSAIVAKSAQIDISAGTLAEFVNNTALYGGAMALHGFSILELFPDSQIVFDSNYASELGGAVYATSPHQSDFILSHKCFISYNDSFLHPDKWNTLLNFTGNTAKYGHAIYTDSLLPCARFAVDFNVSSALKWTPFKYTMDIEQYTIATSPANVQFTLPSSIAPGERINLHPISRDDLDHPMPSAYQVIIESTMGAVKTSPYISDDGYLTIMGGPGTEFNLTLKTQSTRHVFFIKTGKLGNCPIGFILEEGECVCSAQITDKYFVGIPQCDVHIFRAFLQTGYWVGCTDSNETITGYCPFEYCNYKNSSDFEYIIIPITCEEINICTSHRRGQFCGECDEGYTVYFHSDKYTCGKCQYGAIGILLYILSELLPLVLLFAIIMIMKLNMTSGIMQSLLIFAHTIPFINRPLSSQASYTLIRIHSFIFGFLSLDFFKLDELSYCLWDGATVLDNLVFTYLTTFIAFLFLGTVVLIIEHSPSNARMVCCSRIIKRSRTPIIHCIKTILILPYTKYTVTSFQILSRLTVTGEGGIALGSVVHLQGDVDYFGEEHLPYAIPAVLVLVFLTLPPPLLLISYPLLWKIKAKCRPRGNDNDTTLWLIRKLLPLIDSFQGVFRDNCRMFAGLLLLWRVILAAIFAFSADLDLFYFLITTAILSLFAIHTVARPYKIQLYNVIDILMLGNMYVIARMSRHIYISSFDKNVSRKAIESMIFGQIILMYLPLILLVGFILFKFLPDNMKFEPNQLSARADTIQKMPQKQRQQTIADEDLFARAAELNQPPLVLSASEAGVKLHSNESSHGNNSKDSNENCDAIN